MAITLKTDKQGLKIVDRARVKKSWTALSIVWCREANVSVSTLKRFRERKAIQKDAFIAICTAVGIHDWPRIVCSTSDEVSVLRRSYRQSKRIIAEEVLSNLSSLDARLDFVEQAFSDSLEPNSSKAKQLKAKRVALEQKTKHCSDINPDQLLAQYPLKLEANVSIIQILMEVEA